MVYAALNREDKIASAELNHKDCLRYTEAPTRILSSTETQTQNHADADKSKKHSRRNQHQASHTESSHNSTASHAQSDLRPAPSLEHKVLYFQQEIKNTESFHVIQVSNTL